MRNLNKSLLVFLSVCLILPNLAFASWWNPFSWFANSTNQISLNGTTSNIQLVTTPPSSNTTYTINSALNLLASYKTNAEKMLSDSQYKSQKDLIQIYISRIDAYVSQLKDPKLLNLNSQAITNLFIADANKLVGLANDIKKAQQTEIQAKQSVTKANTTNKTQEATTTKKTLKVIPSKTVNSGALGLIGMAVQQATENEYFSGTYGAIGGLPPYHYQLATAGGFPPQGIVLAPDGFISGTPSIKGSKTFEICVVDTAGKSACGHVTIVVSEKQETPPPTPEPTPTPTPEPETQSSISLSSQNCGACPNEGDTSKCLVASGNASGPIGASVNIESAYGTFSSCGSWTLSGDGGSCQRNDGQPADTNWSLTGGNGGMTLDLSGNYSKTVHAGPCY